MKYYAIGNKETPDGKKYVCVGESKSRKAAQALCSMRNVFEYQLDNIGWVVLANSKENALENVRLRKCKNLFKK